MYGIVARRRAVDGGLPAGPRRSRRRDERLRFGAHVDLHPAAVLLDDRDLRRPVGRPLRCRTVLEHAALSEIVHGAEQARGDGPGRARCASNSGAKARGSAREFSKSRRPAPSARTGQPGGAAVPGSVRTQRAARNERNGRFGSSMRLNQTGCGDAPERKSLVKTAQSHRLVAANVVEAVDRGGVWDERSPDSGHPEADRPGSPRAPRSAGRTWRGPSSDRSRPARRRARPRRRG